MRPLAPIKRADHQHTDPDFFFVHQHYLSSKKLCVFHDICARGCNCVQSARYYSTRLDRVAALCMESFREFLSQSLLLSSAFAILFIASGILVACCIVQPGIFKLVDWILGPEHRAAKREREAQAAANLIAWENAEAACREAGKAGRPVDWWTSINWIGGFASTFADNSASKVPRATPTI